MPEEKKMTELELGSIKVEMMAEDGNTIKDVLATRTTIESLMNDCYLMNIEEKNLKAKLTKKKDELKGMLKSLTITKITGEDFTTSYITSSKFRGWKDEEALLELIPESLRGLQTMTPDRTKIEALIKAKEIPKEALDFRKFNDIKSIRFTPRTEDFTPETD